MTTTPNRIPSTDTRASLRRSTRRLAATVAVAAGPLAVRSADAASAGIQTNHNEGAGRDRGRQRRRQALVALALTAGAAISTGAGAAVVPSLSAAGATCSPFVCGSSGNHNESTGRDR